MNILGKFYADAKRRMEKQPDSSFRQELCSFFIQTIRSYDKSLLPLAESAGQHWLDTHQLDTREDGVNWFYSVFALFDGSFSVDMDFSDEDWDALDMIISESAESLDMNTVQTLLSVMVERHKFE